MSFRLEAILQAMLLLLSNPVLQEPQPTPFLAVDTQLTRLIANLARSYSFCLSLYFLAVIACRYCTHTFQSIVLLTIKVYIPFFFQCCP